MCKYHSNRTSQAVCQYNNTSGLLWHRQGHVQSSCQVAIFDKRSENVLYHSTSSGINMLACMVKQHIKYPNMKESLNSQNTAKADSSKYTEKK